MRQVNEGEYREVSRENGKSTEGLEAAWREYRVKVTVDAIRQAIEWGVFADALRRASEQSWWR